MITATAIISIITLIISAASAAVEGFQTAGDTRASNTASELANRASALSRAISAKQAATQKDYDAVSGLISSLTSLGQQLDGRVSAKIAQTLAAAKAKQNRLYNQANELNRDSATVQAAAQQTPKYGLSGAIDSGVDFSQIEQIEKKIGGK